MKKKPITDKQALETLIFDEFLYGESAEEIALKRKMSEKEIERIIRRERKRSEKNTR